MAIKMGPVLAFQGADAGKWRVSAIVVVDVGKPPDMNVSAGAVSSPVQLLALRAGEVWRFDLAVDRGAQDKVVTYGLEGGPVHSFVVPAKRKAPRSAYASCNGFSDPNLMKRVDDKNERWTHLLRLHAQAPYHLLLLGGDQVYADQIWTSEAPAIRDWSELPRSRRIKAAFTKEMERQTQTFYFNLYVRRWRQAEPAQAFASIPALMMWDDHDIFDGWGSHSDEENQCPVFQGIFETARTLFSVFQRQCAPGTPIPGQLPDQPGFTWAHQFDGLSILAPDLRSERRNDRVMGPSGTGDSVVAWLDALTSDVGHLLVLTSIPVIYADLQALEAFLGLLPGDQELEDDLRDHWSSPPHQGERLRLIHRLLDVARTKSVRVTIISGDVHCAALGVIESRRHADAPTNSNVINQLTSSGIVHPPPPGAVRWAVEHLMAGSDEPDRGIETRLLELPGAPHKIIGARNWLALEPDDSGRIWANWHVEGAKGAYTKVIHPVG